jgi:hypothetical protein
MSIEVIDNYLPLHVFEELQSVICWNKRFPWSLSETVSSITDNTLEELSFWYAVHIFYDCDNPLTPMYGELIRPTLIQKLHDDDRMKSLIRAKGNFYGYTSDLVEHPAHVDYEFSHNAAVFSLNTCNGFTRIGDEVVESIANRIVFFDGSVEHNSSTTTNQKGRFNINLNFL